MTLMLAPSKPVHTSNDGDTIFTFASGEVESSTDAVAIVATEAMQQAIENAVLHAKGRIRAFCSMRSALSAKASFSDL